MAINYARLQAVADKLIDANGQDVTFYHLSHTPLDSTKPWRGAGAEATDVTVVAKAVVIPNDEIDDKESMRRGDATAYVAADAFGPSHDMVTFDRMIDSEGYTWHVHGVKLINPGGVRVLYECVLEH